MRVMAINSSPRSEGQSKTEWMLSYLVDGMKSAGADVQTVNLRDKKIKYCSGCFSCWTKTPGKCIHQDDMTREIFSEWIASDLAVYATPLYHFTINAQMKTFIERTLPLLQPFFQEIKGRTSHPLRHKPPSAVVVSVAGFPEERIFDQMSGYVRFLFGKGLLAEIYRPAAETMMQAGMEKIRTSIGQALSTAGRELVQTKTVSPATMHTLKQPVVNDIKLFHEMGNVFWKTCIAEGVTPKQFAEKGLIPRPDSLTSFMIITKMGFNPEGARDVKATMQYHFSGSVQGDCYFSIESGRMTAVEGTCSNPTLSIDAPFDVWMDIMTGKADGQQMFAEQKYSVAGDRGLLMKMGEMFGR